MLPGCCCIANRHIGAGEWRFLALACLHFGAWLVSCRFVLVPVRGWFLALACLHFGAWLVSCLYLLRQLIPHVRFQVPFLGPESQLKSGFACAGLLCTNLPRPAQAQLKKGSSRIFFPSNAFMASARSSNTFNCMLQNRVN